MIGYCRDNVVYCLWRSVLWLYDTSFSKNVWIKWTGTAPGNTLRRPFPPQNLEILLVISRFLGHDCDHFVYVGTYYATNMAQYHDSTVIEVNEVRWSLINASYAVLSAISATSELLVKIPSVRGTVSSKFATASLLAWWLEPTAPQTLLCTTL